MPVILRPLGMPVILRPLGMPVILRIAKIDNDPFFRNAPPRYEISKSKKGYRSDTPQLPHVSQFHHIKP
ncbi:MAG: hypothetical protein DRR16_12585 [Candidatus Parabeggiatoa sp. nov. 3]|nr:MAG: hypothetical protein DRR00_15190 [Gammaproteobacteria bacterium]RKZ62186.1 MAG: hypothetical protein DRQ99_19165 [Gammaproteobacteria bacterium]RKZ85214.1 MAG: hypothetical protein DRR16_12585 [Gammaproteobacteria bacterium]